MTDLDRKIAELKGWRHVPAGTEKVMLGSHATLSEGWVEPTPKGEWYHAAFNCDWSGSDSKALELVDELTRPDSSRLHMFAVNLQFCEDFGWRALFQAHGPGRHQVKWKQCCEGPTRPEAICRAYIAAREWMEKQGK